ncbi:HesA/MoeB/ThiF family protein [Falsibacillus pallidus]|uniref:Molybdopterin/thiamine biosynthesis adenylyltransferase n=1 Tax=Falsibacillus pallidus TaxID=493781 RepID=A0A370GPB1_9BACI|nr:ThiF family adenylyltransferase [Falsibacillus pallidus]RDI45582.1 molybdopterin/thiamine biosynthesis adenylyltransferase [Falsibacillus pallidus]
MKPKFKEIMKPIVSVDESIRIGFEGEIFDIDNPDNFTLHMLEQFDGTKNIEELAGILEVSVEEVLEAVEMFNEIGLLEDADDDPTIVLTNEQKERYRANLTYFSNYADMTTKRESFQEKLKDATVAVLGLGGASLDAACLAGLGVGKIIGLDYDTVDISNLNRQFLYSENNIGQLKANAALQRIKELNSDIEMEVLNMKVMNAEGLMDVLKDVDLVINGIDSPGIIASRWVNSACTALNIPFLQGGISNTNIIWEKIIPNSSGCYDCFLIHFLRVDPYFQHQLMALYNQTFERRNTAIAPHVALLSGFIISEAAKIISGHEASMPASTSHIFNTKTIEITKEHKWDKLPECPTCGNNGSHSVEPVDIEQLLSISKEKEMMV